MPKSPPSRRLISGPRAFGLPLDLGDGLTLRFAVKSDIERLLAFNQRILGEPDVAPEPFLTSVRRLMDGRHPTTRIGDFTVVTDERRKGAIVSSLVLISQTFAFDGIPFKVGRPELIGTDPDYRRKGLVRAQMDVLHRRSAARGEIVQLITGIPWYYRLFGYEMAMELAGGRPFFWARRGNSKSVGKERFTWRSATLDDAAVLSDLYESHSGPSLVTTMRDSSVWHYELEGENLGAAFAARFRIIADLDGKAVAYAAFHKWPNALSISEMGVRPGTSWREVALFLTHRMKEEAEAERKVDSRDRSGFLNFVLGTEHPVYTALGNQLEEPWTPYAWYVRIADVARFLRLVRPVLERRLANSPLCGHSGTLRLNLVRTHLRLVFKRGRLAAVGKFVPKRLSGGDAFFPEESFLRLLFGQKTIDDLEEIRADVHSRKEEAHILLSILFPRRPSHPVGLM